MHTIDLYMLHNINLHNIHQYAYYIDLYMLHNIDLHNIYQYAHYRSIHATKYKTYIIYTFYTRYITHSTCI